MTQTKTSTTIPGISNNLSKEQATDASLLKRSRILHLKTELLLMVRVNRLNSSGRLGIMIQFLQTGMVRL